MGTGIGTAQLVSFDIETGARTEITPPATSSVIAALGTAGTLLLVPLPGRVLVAARVGTTRLIDNLPLVLGTSAAGDRTTPEGAL